MHELRRNYKHHLIEIPDIFSMGPSYIPLYSILELPATGLFISFTNNQIQSESSTEIVVGRKLSGTMSDVTVIPSYIEDAYCMAVLGRLLSHVIG